MARKKYQRHMTLGEIEFPTKKEAHQYIKAAKREQIEKGALFVHRGSELYAVLNDVFKRHPDNLAAREIRAFEFAQHAEVAWSHHGIIIHYQDGTSYRFPKLERGLRPDWDLENNTDGREQGWLYEHSEERRRNNAVLRWEIAPDIQEFREIGEMCEECGQPVEYDVAHVDHAGPSFVDIRDGWLTLQGVRLHELQVERCPHSIDGAQWLADRKLADSWVRYHAEHMVLEYVHHACHLQRTAARRQA